MSKITQSLSTPYYAVIFTSVLSDQTLDETHQNNSLDLNRKPTGAAISYSEMANRMIELAEQQDGFLGIDSARETVGITVSYWRDLEAIAKWKADIEHVQAQKLGRAHWYESYNVRICKVEKDYSF